MLLVLVLATAIPSLGVSSCAGTPPAINARQWVGESATGSVVSSSGEVVECRDAQFDRFGCYRLEDLDRIWSTVYGCCERWSRACVSGSLQSMGASP